MVSLGVVPLIGLVLYLWIDLERDRRRTKRHGCSNGTTDSPGNCRMPSCIGKEEELDSVVASWSVIGRRHVGWDRRCQDILGGIAVNPERAGPM